MYHESFTGSRFPSAVSPSEFEKKIPSKPVSSSSPVSLPDSANAIWPAYLRKKYWNLLSLTKNNKQATKRIKFSVLASFYNFSINTGLPALTNPCNASVIKKIFKRPQAIQWNIVDKETIDEIIFRTTNTRNRLILELMARGGMRVGEVLNLTPGDLQERSLVIQNPKSGRAEKTVYVPRKIMVRLTGYVRVQDIGERPHFSHFLCCCLVYG